MRTYEAIQSARQGQLWGDLKRQNDSRGRRDTYRSDHVALVAALRARNTDRAITTMRTHLGRVEANLFGPSSR
jgi:DNA-binding GntR family transcriptional regulator